ncbi:MAG: hypothetical protein PHZ04_00505 [Patescibacteria group bacterium]|nr:hypothetical protein [Patescibacteria group bacterium]MDD5295195.1 hypothetical protein [Patescibacteria group bacterium]MDD5554753.1 hypothetical protein [Patescibacteria group bacterium]
MEDEIKKLLEENLKLTAETHKMVKKIKSYMFWQNVWSFLKVLIVVVPIILGIIYLPPLLKGVFQQYKSLLGGGVGLNLENLGGSDLLGNLINGNGGTKIPADLEKYLPR